MPDRQPTVYRIHVPSFQDSDGDGLGDFLGVARRLDYVAGLGVDAIAVCEAAAELAEPARAAGLDVLPADDCPDAFEGPWTPEGLRKLEDARTWAPDFAVSSPEAGRVASRAGEELVRLTATYQLTARCKPWIYYGDEIGMTDAELPDGAGAVTPMEWDSGPFGGFSTVSPGIPLGSEKAFRSVSVQMDQPDSVLNMYKRLLSLRRKHQALHRGTMEEVGGGSESCFCFLRQALDAPGYYKRLFVALNLGDSPEHVVLPGPGRVMFWSHAPGEDTNLVEMIRLGAREAAVCVLFS